MRACVRGGTLGLLVLALLVPAEPALAQGDPPNVLVYSGTTGYRHNHTGEAIQPQVVDLIQSRLAEAGIESDYETCGNSEQGQPLPGLPRVPRRHGGGNPAIFTPENLAQYDALVFWQASSQFRNASPRQDRCSTPPSRTRSRGSPMRVAGIAAMHASVTMGAGAGHLAVVGRPGQQRDRRPDARPLGDRYLKRRRASRSPTATTPRPATCRIEYEFGDEHYTFSE